MLGRLKKGKVAGAEFEFAERVRDAEDDANISSGVESSPISATTASLATENPRAAIIVAWLEIETALQALVSKLTQRATYGPVSSRPTRPSRNVLESMRIVQDAGILETNYVALFNDLRAMRNDAAHRADFAPLPEDVLRYVKLANELSSRLRKATESLIDNRD